MAPRKICVNGVELHYIERGTGEPLVLVHGGLGDYRSWQPQLAAFARRFRVLSYSRRYSYPNENAVVPDHSVLDEAEDLSALVSNLQVGPAHLVGHSYGAFAALALALKRPRTARTLVLAEPPVHEWVRAVPGGEQLFSAIVTAVWQPVRRSLECGDTERALRIFTDGIGGPGYFESLSARARAQRIQNIRALRIMMQSSKAFPGLPRHKVRRLTIPTLIIEGENTAPIHRMVDDELLRCIPRSERVIVAGTGHGTPADKPGAFNEAVLSFLSRALISPNHDAATTRRRAR
jgi:pimeloyl-ACP methyl ester carboxylesterase